MAAWNHVGLCVTDVDRSIHFYEGVFGFVEDRRMDVPDRAASQLLRVERPVGLSAVYLTLGTNVLELIHFARDGNPPARERPFTEPGLTHMSFTVDDLAATCDLVIAHGGEVLEDTNTFGAAVLVRDPDGQLLELIAS